MTALKYIAATNPDPPLPTPAPPEESDNGDARSSNQYTTPQPATIAIQQMNSSPTDRSASASTKRADAERALRRRGTSFAPVAAAETAR